LKDHFANIPIKKTSMKHSFVRRSVPGFTLIEMLVVIAIIAILAGILLPVLASAKEKARVAQAKTEVRNFAAAIVAYQGDQSVYPTSADDPNAKNAQDATYTTNATAVIILLDLDTPPNEGHRRNPQKHVYLNAKMVNNTSLPGISRIDNIFRDPWGRPYIITLDLDYDNKCHDSILNIDVPAPVLVWSLGRDGQAKTKDDVTSW
jgi:prepilin-type N-terminal cleavage/methylation domain-containing protein